MTLLQFEQARNVRPFSPPLIHSTVYAGRPGKPLLCDGSRLSFLQSPCAYYPGRPGNSFLQNHGVITVSRLRIWILLLTGLMAGCGAQEEQENRGDPDKRIISEAFELRYVSDDPAADGETDFKGETAIWDTDDRLEYLQHWQEYARDFFGDPDLNTQMVPEEELENATAQLKEQPEPEVRREIRLNDWNYLGHRPGQRGEERQSIEQWGEKPGAQVVDGELRLEQTRIGHTFEPQTWRAHFWWDVRAPEDDAPVVFRLSEAVEAGFDGEGSIYYITDGDMMSGPDYEPGQWYSFKVELDLAAEGGRYNLLVDDDLVADFAALSGSLKPSGLQVPSEDLHTVDSFHIETESDIALDELRITGHGEGVAPEGRDDISSIPYRINTIIDENFEVREDPAGFEELAFDDSDWERVPYPRYAHGGERRAGEHLYLRREVEVGSFKRAVLDIETVRPSGDLYINGRHIAELDRHPARVDVTEALQPNTTNVVAMRVNPHDTGSPHSSHHMSVDTHSSWFAGMTTLELTGQQRIEDVFAYTTNIDDPANLRLEIEARGDGDAFEGRVVARVYPWYPDESDDPAGQISEPLTFSESMETVLDLKIPDPMLWTVHTPRLYKIHVILEDQAGTPIDDKVVTTGLRTVSQEGGKFRINGESTMLNGPLIFGHYAPLERIAQWMFSPPPEKYVEQILGVQRMNGNLFRMSVHDNRTNSGVSDRRLARMADQLGMMFMWQTPAWAREGPTDEYDLEGLPKYAKDVRNHPSIVMWQPSNHPSPFVSWENEVLEILESVDQSRLIAPVSKTREGWLSWVPWEEWPDDVPYDESWWNHPLLARGTMEQTFGYGKEWTAIRMLGSGHDGMVDNLPDRERLRYLNSDTHAFFDFESEESISQPNWRLHRGQPRYNVFSYEYDYDEGSIGRRLTTDEWKESQAWQALTAAEGYRKKRWLGYSGTSWCPLRGGGNTATYMKPAVDYENNVKLTYHAMAMIYQETLAGSKNVSLVYGPNDDIPVIAMNLGEAKTVEVQVTARPLAGGETVETRFEDVYLPAGQQIVELGDWDPDLEPGYYAFEYTIRHAEAQIDE